MFATYAAAYGISAVMQKGLGFIIFFWIARTLPKNEFAVFGLLYALQTGLIAIATSGVVEMVIGHHRTHVDSKWRHGLYSIGNGVFVWLMLLAAMSAIGIYFIQIANYANFLDVALIFVGSILLAFFTLQSSFFRLNEEHSQSLILSFFPPVLGLISAYVGVVIWGNLTAFFATMAVALLTIFLIFSGLKLVHLRVNMRVSELVSVKAEILPYMAIALLAWLTGYGSTFLLDFKFDLVEVAKFTFIYTLSSVLQIAATALNQVWSPRFFRLAEELTMHELERKNEAFYALQGAVLGLIGAIVLLLLRPVIDITGGNLAGYRDAGKDLAWLFAGYAMCMPWWHTQNYYYLNKQGGPLMIMVMLSTTLGLMVWFGLMLMLGVDGIYIGFFVLMMIRSTVVWLHARAIWQIRLMWHGPLAAVSMLLVGLMISKFI